VQLIKALVASVSHTCHVLPWSPSSPFLLSPFAVPQDDVPEAVKQRRLKELIDVYRQQLYLRNASELGRTHLVLVEGPSRRSGERGLFLY
jgi:tRNA A37 methylthiotransferase MiaB